MKSSNNPFFVWESTLDINRLPASNLGSLSLTELSSVYSPICASLGVCTTAGTCKCASGFIGTSCESCASGFFASKCQPCPSNCRTCDDGTTGTGICLKPVISNNPSHCNCLNGVCGSKGQCSCNAGFTTASNVTASATCNMFAWFLFDVQL